MARVLVALSCCLALNGCGGNPAEPGSTGKTRTLIVGPSAEFRTIQSAIDVAPAGAIIEVNAGVYAEHVVVTKSLSLRGAQAVLDGLAGRLDGRYLGMEVHANAVEISGFVVQNFERGIVIDGSTDCRIVRNEIRNNLSKDPQPISPGVTKSDGMLAFAIHNCDISDNYIHDNGSIGLWIGKASSGNQIRRNRIVNNGSQQAPLGGYFGTGLLTSGGNNTRNEITENEVTGNDWGIDIGGQPDSENVVRNNRVRGNRRSGIAVGGQHNVIESNDAAGNALIPSLAPSCSFDLLEFDVVDNTWSNNTGTFGTYRAFSPLSCP